MEILLLNFKRVGSAGAEKSTHKATGQVFFGLPFSEDKTSQKTQSPFSGGAWLLVFCNATGFSWRGWVEEKKKDSPGGCVLRTCNGVLSVSVAWADLIPTDGKRASVSLGETCNSAGNSPASISSFWRQNRYLWKFYFSRGICPSLPRNGLNYGGERNRNLFLPKTDYFGVVVVDSRTIPQALDIVPCCFNVPSATITI